MGILMDIGKIRQDWAVVLLCKLHNLRHFHLADFYLTY